MCSITYTTEYALLLLYFVLLIRCLRHVMFLLSPQEATKVSNQALKERRKAHVSSRNVMSSFPCRSCSGSWSARLSEVWLTYRAEGTYIHTRTHSVYTWHIWSAHMVRAVWAVIYFGWTWAADRRNLEINNLSGICAQWTVLIGMNGIASRNAAPASSLDQSDKNVCIQHVTWRLPPCHQWATLTRTTNTHVPHTPPCSWKYSLQTLFILAQVQQRTDIVHDHKKSLKHVSMESNHFVE